MNDCEEISGIVPRQMEAYPAALPSKIEALIADIKTFSPHTKWYFSDLSFWSDKWIHTKLSQRCIFDLETNSRHY
jgi:hypothetical protein